MSAGSERDPRRGFVYATTGEDYTILARRSARTLRQVCPGAQIDLFTDQPVDDPVFDRIHALTTANQFPKIEAMGRSRFRDTILLDADTVPLTDISELFGMTRRYLISCAMGTSRPAHILRAQRDIPRWEPVLNTGLMVFRRGRRTRQFARAWAKRVRDGEEKFDQTPFRRLVNDLGLRVGIVPPEYNLIFLEMLEIWQKQMAAPRLLHVRALHWRPPGDPETPIPLREVVSEEQAAMIEQRFADESQWRTDTGPLPWLRRNRLGLALLRLWKRLTY